MGRLIKSPEQVLQLGDILEYKNPANLTLRELMKLAEGQVDFEKQEQRWG